MRNEQTKRQKEEFARNLEYVESTLADLREYWLARPHLRLGQIVSNSWRIHPDYKRNPEPEINDIYYLTDGKFREGLLELIENESKDSRTVKE
jgi:hypothetical protein